MDRLNEFKKYIETKINEINESKSFINQSSEIVNNLDTIYNLIINRRYKDIDIDVLSKCLNYIFEIEDAKLMLEKLKEAILIISTIENKEIPQVTTANSYIEEICNLILKKSQKLKEDIFKRKAEVDDAISKYEEYFDLVKDGKIVRHLNETKLKTFFGFLNTTTLDKNAILELTILFSKDSLDYAEKLRNLRMVKEDAIKKDNVARVKEKINKQNKEQLEDAHITEVKFTLTEEEDKIYYQILDIINDLGNDFELTHDALTEILKDDFTIKARTSIYDSTDNKFNLILEDLKFNLIPEFKNNKESIIKIFKYIIGIFNKEYIKPKEQIFISQVEDFNEKEQQEIQRFIEIVQRELTIYNHLDEKEKNMIESIKQLIEDSGDDVIEIDEKFSTNYVKFIELLERFSNLYKDYLENRKNEKEYVTSGLCDDINSCLDSQMLEIRDILRKLNRVYELVTQERNKRNTPAPTIENPNFTPDRKTLFVFLPIARKETYCATIDQEEILKVKKEVMEDVSSGLYNFSVIDYNSFIYSSESNNRNLANHNKNIPTYSDEVKAYRFRKGEARIAYTKLSLSKYNQERIKEAYGVEKADVVLIIGFKDKLTDSSDIYDYFNSRISREINGIRHIFNLFGTDFDEHGFEEACTLIDDSDKICELLYKNPTKRLDINGLGGR